MREAFGGQQFVIRGAPTRRMRGYHEGGIRGSSVKSSVLAKYGATHAR